jgi:TRAP-type C4-dicarboxylate transport system permease small subunit
MKPVTKHRLDGVSLGFGLVFLIAVLTWVFGSNVIIPAIPLPGLGWLLALALILFGVLGLLRALRGGRRRQRPEDEWE